MEAVVVGQISAKLIKRVQLRQFMRCSKPAVQIVSITEDEASIQLCTTASNAEGLHTRHASCRCTVPAIRAVTGAGLTAAEAGALSAETFC